MNITEEQPSPEQKILDETMQKVQAEIHKQKEGIIRKRLKELGLEYKLKNSAKRRFKKIMIEVDDQFEHVFVDNNTIEGLRVVSFAITDPVMVDNELKMDLKYF